MTINKSLMLTQNEIDSLKFILEETRSDEWFDTSIKPSISRILNKLDKLTNKELE